MRIKNHEPSTRPEYTQYLSGDSPQLIAGGQHDKNEAGHRHVHTAVRYEVKPVIPYLTVSDSRMAIPFRGDCQHLSGGVDGNDSDIIPACDSIGDSAWSTSVVEKYFRSVGTTHAESSKRKGVPQRPSKPAINLGKVRRSARVVGRVPVGVHVLIRSSRDPVQVYTFVSGRCAPSQASICRVVTAYLFTTNEA